MGLSSIWRCSMDGIVPGTHTQRYQRNQPTNHPHAGGLAVSLRVRGTSLCFVSCHLAAHEGEKYLRQVGACGVGCLNPNANDNINNNNRKNPQLSRAHDAIINQTHPELPAQRERAGDHRGGARGQAPQCGSGSDPPPLLLHGRCQLPPGLLPQPRAQGQAVGRGKWVDTPCASVFPCVCISSARPVPLMPTPTKPAHRPDQQRAAVLSMIERKDWEGLYALDELQQQLKEENVLVGFATPAPDFAPTFKVRLPVCMYVYVYVGVGVGVVSCRELASTIRHKELLPPFINRRAPPFAPMRNRCCDTGKGRWSTTPSACPPTATASSTRAFQVTDCLLSHGPGACTDHRTTSASTRRALLIICVFRCTSATTNDRAGRPPGRHALRVLPRVQHVGPQAGARRL